MCITNQQVFNHCVNYFKDVQKGKRHAVRGFGGSDSQDRCALGSLDTNNYDNLSEITEINFYGFRIINTVKSVLGIRNFSNFHNDIMELNDILCFLSNDLKLYKECCEQGLKNIADKYNLEYNEQLVPQDFEQLEM